MKKDLTDEEQKLMDKAFKQAIANELAGEKHESETPLWVLIVEDLQKEVNELRDHIDELRAEYQELLERNRVMLEALKYIDDECAPPMHKYNEIEFKMVTKARQALREL